MGVPDKRSIRMGCLQRRVIQVDGDGSGPSLVGIFQLA